MERYKMKNKYRLYIILLCIVGTLLPVLIDKLIIANSYFSSGHKEAWISFFGSYGGAIIGSIATILGISITIDYTNNQAKKERNFVTTQENENRRLQIAPYLKYDQYDELLKEKVVRVAEQKNVLLKHLYHKPLINPDDLYEELMEYKAKVKPFVCDTSLFLHNALKEGKNILLEGQLGSLKDPDHGIYPMVTSSSTLAGYGAIGAGIPPYEIQKIVTVCKAYSSAVGAGAFVSEIFGEEADELRRRGGDGGEFGATTGRPRRMGWFDCVASKYGCRMQGATDVAFTVVDVLGYLDEIPVCVGYEIDGEVTTEFPTTHLLEKAKPVFKTLPGWKCDIRGIKKYEDLPENCRNYIEFIEKEIGYPITMVSNGPGRHDIIFRNK